MRELPQGWTLAAISDVTGGAEQYQLRLEEQFYYIDISSIDRELKKIVNPQRLTRDKAPSRARQVVKVGDVLVSMTRPSLNAVALVTHEWDGQIASTGFDVLRPIEIESRWLFNLVKASDFIAAMSERVQGALYPAVRPRDIRGYVIPLAPINEQIRIADKLDVLLARVDACRERLDRVPQILKRFRQTVLAAAASGVLTKEWRERKCRQFDWKANSGAEVFSFITSGSRGWAAYYADSGSKFLRVGNLDHDTIKLDLSQIQYVSPPLGAEGVRTKVKVGDILISITADVGMIGLVSEDIGEAYINQHLCLARQNGSNVGAYLAYYLASPTGGLQQLTAAQRGVTKAGLTLGDIRNLMINIPEEDEQTEIVRRVETLFAFADRLEARYTAGREQIIQLIPSLLDKAFCGELVPQDPNDEPASELLKRIKEQKTNEPEQKRKPRANTIKNERHMNTKEITTLDELASVLDQLGGDAMADRLVIESGLSDDIDRFFELLREGRNTLLDVPVGSNTPIRRKVDANQ